MERPLDVCWGRIARADTHRQAIANAWSAFVREDPYDPIARIDEHGRGTLCIQQLLPIPEVIAFELGEFLYQLRAALDACIYEVACENTGLRPPPDEHKLEFPICESAEHFNRAARKIAALTQQQRQIVWSVQPYNMPADLSPDLIPFNFHRSLSILNDWARKDRHRKLHVVALWASNIMPLIIIPNGARLVEFKITSDDGFILREEREVATFRVEGWEPKMRISANPNLMLDIAVDEAPLPASDFDTLDSRLRCMKVAVATIADGMAKTVGVTAPG